MSEIKVVQFTSSEVEEQKELAYQQFLKYYKETDLKVNEIYKLLGLNNRDSTTRYIKSRLNDEGYDPLKRSGLIRRGKWLKIV